MVKWDGVYAAITSAVLSFHMSFYIDYHTLSYPTHHKERIRKQCTTLFFAVVVIINDDL